MKFRHLGAVCMLATSLLANSCTEIYGAGNTQIRLATGSPGELGLVKAIAEEFSARNDVQICWIKAGSGKTLELLKGGEIDIAMVHAPKAEKQAIKEGWARNRTLIGSNEFYIIGDKSDPAGIREAKSAVEAYTKIAQSKALFYTRADNSGTHKKELAIWKMAGIEPNGEWYVANKDFMLATLKKADETKGYFMTDSSTYKTAKNELKNSEILFRGDKILVNTYVAMSRAKPRKIDAAFIAFLASKQGQNLIENYGKEHGEALYEGAAYAKQFFEE